MERNPYFWQVETEGNQLPYLDRLQWRVLQGAQAILLETIAGNVDMQARLIATLANQPALYQTAGTSCTGARRPIPTTWPSTSTTRTRTLRCEAS